MNVVKLAEVKPVPWRNGGGTTRELLAWPDAGDWKIRISIADVVADGPFSRFDGIERWFAVLEGEGVRLSFPSEVVHELRRDSEPLCFDGGDEVTAELIDGPTLDFNLMAPPGVATLRREGGILHVESSIVSARYDPLAARLYWEAHS
jgi:uncharacterized protein